VAFQLRKGESIAHGLERIVRRELRDAIDQLAGMDVSEGAVHEARKSIKKVRAILLLVGDDIGANDALKQLRRAGRALAPLRDAEALMHTASELSAGQPVSEATRRALRKQLSTRHSRLIGSPRSRRLNKEAAAVLKEAHRSARHWHWREVGVADRAPSSLQEGQAHHEEGARTTRREGVSHMAETREDSVVRAAAASTSPAIDQS
jgi:CHAD domain-containing protein